MFRIKDSPIAALALLSAGLLTTACTSSHNQSETNKIIGAGSTFINPIMSHWISDFQSTHGAVQINYQSIGSGGGIQQLKQGLEYAKLPPSLAEQDQRLIGEIQAGGQQTSDNQAPRQ